MSDGGRAVLSVEELRVHFRTEAGVVKAVDGVSWAVGRGETLAVVGESGAGKSVSALAVMGLLPEGAKPSRAGRVLFNGHDLLRADPAHLRRVRGREISMIFQDPLSSLNPVLKVGHQIAEVIQIHEKVGRVPARRRAVDLLAEVGIANPRQRAGAYPHELSGGMRQRAMVAMALALDPVVLLADEPTTALDVTVAAQIMDLLARLQAERGTAIVLITHDLGIVAGHADRVVVMYAGRSVEVGNVDAIYHRPRHAYTLGLLSSVARLDGRRRSRLQPIPGQPPSLLRVPPGCPFHPRCPFATDLCRRDIPVLQAQYSEVHQAACHHGERVAEAAAAFEASFSAPGTDAPRRPADRRRPSGTDPRAGSPTSPLLEVAHLVKHYPVSSGLVVRRRIGDLRAVDDVSFDVGHDEVMALVGESGCGKTTTARAVLRLIEPSSGLIRFKGEEITRASGTRLRALRREMQAVFQDPYASLNPRMTVRNILEEPFAIHRMDASQKVPDLLSAVGLRPEDANRYPHELSGGERQRIGIARSIALEPELVVCDEPVWALDVSITAQVLNLLADLRAERGLAYLFIAHDLSVVRHIADRVAVMYLGQIVELADRDTLFEVPCHPYAQALIASVPVPDPWVERSRERRIVTGEVPSPLSPPSGCRFRTRCVKFAEDLSESERRRCVDEPPALVDRGQGHPSACHYAEAGRPA